MSNLHQPVQQKRSLNPLFLALAILSGFSTLISWCLFWTLGPFFLLGIVWCGLWTIVWMLMANRYR
ncbi:membrane protein [Mycobacterium phage SororFago]|nr:membrane protein [Mycobacterium phage SororFago]